MEISQMKADHMASARGTMEPQRRNHFQAEFYLDNSEDQEIIRLSVAGGFLPNEGNEEIEMQWINESVWVAGRRTLQQGSMRIRDFVDRDTAGAIHRWRKLVYDPTTGKVGYAANYKKGGSILVFGPDGVSHVRRWKLYGCWPVSVDPGELNYETNEIVVMTVALRFDRAVPLFAYTE